MDYINIAIALLTIAFGAFGFLAPRYTAGALDLEPTGSTMGLSELRAGSGGLFVAMGLWCLITLDPVAYFALGVAYLGAGAGRALSIVTDKPPFKKALVFLAFEWPPAAYLMWANWPA
ncbi:DUF4345 family protein [Pseudooctadecabacter jejudonensis]|uniref:DUF4345 domain-containing protein n=1 Tax=Pseudooctadecabacter jejudonensis TaxID=1391910 RepID=A0A1Y5RE50_9RHOB|nr:DUF4345 family protein [Pseudooctadecabacter jejudonensis]SLN14146.1 hypothetical protein PSJ8397_00252 [Pseudooctadecabacter jejudonensis]